MMTIMVIITTVLIIVTTTILIMATIITTTIIIETEAEIIGVDGFFVGRKPSTQRGIDQTEEALRKTNIKK